MDFTREQLEKIISEAPERAEFYYHGENVIPYRIVIDGIIFSFKGDWKRAIDHEISRAYLRDSHKLTDLQKQLDEMKMNDSSEEITYENGMRECAKRIALIVGKQFAVNVGYQDLPSVVEAALRDLQGEIVMLEEKLAMNDSQDMQSVDSESVEPKERLYTQSELDAALHSEILQKKDYLKQLQALEGKLELSGNTEEFKSGDVVNTSLGYGVIVGVSIRNPNFWWVELDDEEYARDIHKSGLSKSLTPKKQLRLMMKNAIKLHDLANANYPTCETNDWDSATVEIKEMWVAVAKEIKFKDEIDS